MWLGENTDLLDECGSVATRVAADASESAGDIERRETASWTRRWTGTYLATDCGWAVAEVGTRDISRQKKGSQSKIRK